MAWLLSACGTSRNLASEDFSPSELTPGELSARVPDYRDSLLTVSGKGRAIVSEPGNTERLTIRFSGNRLKSLLEIRNSLGIKGGRMLSDGDTLFIYNAVDRYARKIPLAGGDLRSIDHLASVNLLELLNYPVEAGSIRRVLASESRLLALLETGGSIYISRENGLVQRVEQPESAGLPYSRIDYEGYTEAEGYTLPRKITIFSSDGTARVAFQVQSVEINPELDSLSIDLPDGIRYRQP